MYVKKKKSKSIEKPEKTILKIEFANKEASDHFALWLCESGEQTYWDWMEVREEEDENDITALNFHYHGKEDETKAQNDPARYGEFMCDNTIRTDIGRLNRNK